MPFDNPLVSIALCTYNGEKYLQNQLESIISQTYKNLEIIIVDDCSTDNTFEVIKKLTCNLDNVKVEQNEQNVGFTKNFEIAINQCNGEYIAICDQDDIWNLQKIETLIKEIGENDLIFHDSELIDKDGKLINNLKLSDKTDIYTGNSNLYFLANNCISGHSCMFKKEILSIALPFDKRFFYDWWIAFVVASIGKIKYTPTVLVSYRQHDSNVTNALNSKKNTELELSGNIYFKYNIEWIKYISQFKHLKNKDEINFIYETLLDYSMGKKGLNFLIFLLRYYTKLFIVKNKSTISKYNLIRKIYFAQPIIAKNL